MPTVVFRCYVYLGKNLKLFDNSLFMTYSYEARNFKVVVIDLNVVNIVLLKPNTIVLTQTLNDVICVTFIKAIV